MFGRISLAKLKLDDESVTFDRAMLWVDSDERWRLEINPTNPRDLPAIRPDGYGIVREADMVTISGKAFKGHVRVNHRRLYPFRGVPVLLEGVYALEGFDLEAVDWFD
jgi:hypothetical protein